MLLQLTGIAHNVSQPHSCLSSLQQTASGLPVMVSALSSNQSPVLFCLHASNQLKASKLPPLPAAERKGCLPGQAARADESGAAGAAQTSEC